MTKITRRHQYETNQEDNQEDANKEEPAVKEPQEKAEDLLEDSDEVTESEENRDKKWKKILRTLLKTWKMNRNRIELTR